MKESGSKKTTKADFFPWAVVLQRLAAWWRSPGGSPLSEHIYQIFQFVFNQFLGCQVLGHKSTSFCFMVMK